MQNTIAIIGAGKLGSALARILSDKKDVSISLWDKEEGKVKDQKQLEYIITSADVIFLCVPSWTKREALSSIAKYVKPDAILISFTKGIEVETQKLIPELFEEFFPRNPYGVMIGPMLADEFDEGKRGAAVLGINSQNAFQKISSMFEGTRLTLQYSQDVRGVALAGVLKNIYALLLGMADSLGLGNNMKGILVTRAIREMQNILTILGGDSETALTVAGIGDLITTGSSPYSRNRKVGDELIRTGACSTQCEGYVSLPALVKLLDNQASSFPLLKIAQEICLQKGDARKLFDSLFATMYA